MHQSNGAVLSQVHACTHSMYLSASYVVCCTVGLLGAVLWACCPDACTLTGDVIVGIDGVSTHGMTMMQVCARMCNAQRDDVAVVIITLHLFFSLSLSLSQSLPPSAM